MLRDRNGIPLWRVFIHFVTADGNNALRWQTWSGETAQDALDKAAAYLTDWMREHLVEVGVEPAPAPAGFVGYEPHWYAQAGR
jgi:hypothetical protein